MKLEDQVCSLELAKRLKELAVKQKSLFHWYLCKSNKKPSETHWAIMYSTCKPNFERYSAFTVSELLELLPRQIKYEGERLELYCYYGKDRCYVSYVIEAEHVEIEEYAETEANARAKMLIHLLENGFIKND